jgi:hypothetical protein
MALLVGIDAYPRLSPHEQLHGCVNDVELMASVLRETFGFPEDGITLLRDADATRDGILAAFDSLLAAARPDDVVVVHYSGHGSQMTDREGDEADGLDETIVPHDSGRAPDPNRDITDDEILAWLARLTAVTTRVTLVFDCCHSGTVSRDAFGARARWVAPDLRPVEELPPSPVPGTRAVPGAREVGPSGWLPLSERYVLMAGCRDTESSYEYSPNADGRLHHGALTYFLARELVNAGPTSTYREIFETAGAQVTAVRPRQHPQMEGAVDRTLFGAGAVAGRGGVRVQERRGEAVLLSGGAAHGMTVGSRLVIYPARQTLGADEGAPVGRVEITAVQAVTSEARVAEEAHPQAVAAGARAVEEAHAFGDMRLVVDVDVVVGEAAGVVAGEVAGGAVGEDAGGQAAGTDARALAAGLAAAVAASPLLRAAGDGETAAVRVYLLAARDEPGASEPVPQLGALATPTWAVVGADGALLMPPRPAAEADAGSVIVANLEQLARYTNLLALANPDPESRLAGKVTLELLRRDAGGWVPATPTSSDGMIAYTEGDRLAIELTNRHDQTVFVSVLDFGLSGGVSLLFPPGRPSEPLNPGVTMRYGVREGEDMELFLPDVGLQEFTPGQAGVVGGTESLKLFVTSQEADFGPLFQPGIRGGPGGQTLLDHVLALAQTGVGTRDARPVKRPAGEDWATVTRAFMLHAARPGIALRPDGSPAEVGPVTLRTPGLEGRAVSHPGSSARSRGIDGTTDELSAAFAAAHVAEQQTVEIAGAREVGPATRSTGRGEAALELVVPEPGAGLGQFVLAKDEAGVLRWGFASPDGGATPGTRGLRTRTYRLARTPTTPEAEPGTRGLLGALGSKLLKVLVFPLVDPLIGEVGEFFARRWEERLRPYRVRPFTPEDYREAGVAPLDADGWRRLSTGRSLLFVHGTFSRAHTAFSALPAEVLRELHNRYEGRVFAFDHYTLSENPRQNVEWFLRQVPDGVGLDLDIVCHSRGGLVSRVLVERQSAFSMGSRSLRVDRVILVAVPNAGTILADSKHLGDLLDSYTNLLHFLPDAGITDALEAIITVAKQLAVGVVRGLDGLSAMAPGGEFQRWLNAVADDVGARYYALASNYEPRVSGFREFAKDLLLDTVFRRENDLVVPTQGVWDTNGSRLFPVTQRHVFETTDAIAHSGFFASPAAVDKIRAWLMTA